MGIEAVFFDLDGTLWDFQKNSREVLIDTLHRYQVPVTYEDFFQAYAPINQECWRRYRLGELSPQELNNQRFFRTFEALKMGNDRAWINRFQESYIAGLGNPTNLFPKTQETLEYLRERYTLHVITDGFSELQINKLKRSGIFSYFDTLTFSDEVGATKPDPIIFETALSRANTRPEQSIMIGDHPDFDVKGARQSGLRAIHFDPQSSPSSQGMERITSIFELTKIL